jgi:hypothetical protein
LILTLNIPADPVWVMARISSLLNPYFEKDTPHAIRMMEAEDWSYAFEGLPKWAIDKAVRWWKSNDNTKRRGRPLEGDIVERVLIEMKFVRNAKAGLDMPAPKRHADPDAKVWTPRNVAQKAEADRLTATVGNGLRVAK